MSTSDKAKPWYVNTKNYKSHLLKNSENKIIFFERFNKNLRHVYHTFNLFKYSIFGILSLIFGVLILISHLKEENFGAHFLMLLVGALGLLILSICFFLMQIGSVCNFFIGKTKKNNECKLGYLYIQSKLSKPEENTGLFASDLILKQFVQQVRLYAIEQNYFFQKLKTSQNQNVEQAQSKNLILLQRRWSDIQDTLNEFEIYFAQNIEHKIDDILTRFPTQYFDVTQIFQNIAETFETTWQAKGINIEHAIVVPLNANTNEKILNRLLVGAWRTCAYFAPKGGTVSFSAKTENNNIVARWDCLGAAFPEDFYKIVRNKNLTLNKRIESGMVYISNQPQNSNVLFGLISFIIWHDLASVAGIDFDFKQGNDGMIISLIL